MPEVLSRPGSILGNLLEQANKLGRLELVALLRADQLRRWQQGERLPVEVYLQEVPALLADPELAIDLVFSEFLLRRAVLNEAPSLEEYVERFPDYADALREQHMMEALWQEAAHTQGRGPHAPPTGLAPPMDADGTIIDPAAESRAAQSGTPALPGYEVLGEVGRGGMGLVLKGHDRHLGRDLAVKLLRDNLRGRADLVRRFLNEARICGRLQHPGIVPIYALAQLPDGRPYFTMKLVQGCTLADLLKPSADGGRDQPRLLGIFEQVCQTVAFAHNKGVIHRDLKPDNVMVGDYGEVLVMDWGLAKVLGPDGGTVPLPAPLEAAESGSLSDTAPQMQTQPGGVLGTLPYMPPEQARGEIERMDERCDVFSLGAMLCEILIGAPPFMAASGVQLLAQVKACDHAEALARLDCCGADAQLVRLVKACLAAEPSARPRHAGVVAEQIAAYGAAVLERLRRAELERSAAQARAEEAKTTAAAERKARRRTRALAAAMAALLAVGACGGLALQYLQGKRQTDQARHDAEQRQAVEFALEKTAQLRQQAHWSEAAAVLEQAHKVLGDTGPDDLRQRLQAAESELKLVKRLDGLRQRFEMLLERRLDLVMAAGDYAAAFREAGFGEVGDDAAVVAARVRDSGVAGPLLDALDDWAIVVREPDTMKWILEVARRADPDPWRVRFRDPALWGNQEVWQGMADELLRDRTMLDQLSPHMLALLWGRLGSRPEMMPVLRAAQNRYPDDFWLNLKLGSALYQQKKWDEAIGFFRAAVAQRPDAFAAHINLGNALYEKRELDGAIAEFRRVIDIDPNIAGAHNNLGNALFETKDLDGAITEYTKAIELDPKLAFAHTGLGNALHHKKDLDGAIAEHNKAIELAPRFAMAYSNLGLALRDKKDPDGAIGTFKKAIKFDQNYAPAHINLGLALRDKKDMKGAIAEFRWAIDHDPNYAVLARTNLGMALRETKDLDGAITELRVAIALDPKYALAHTILGNALRDKKNLAGAIAEHNKAIELDPNLALAYNNLGSALFIKGDLEGAIANLRQATKLDPTFALAYKNLGGGLYLKKDLDGAIAAYNKATELDAQDAIAPFSLGNARYEKQDVDGAIAAYKTAIARDPRCAAAYNNLGRTLHSKNDLDGAIAAYKEAIACNANFAGAHNNLGRAFYDKKDLDGAIVAYKTAIRIDGNFALPLDNLGQALLDQGHFTEAATATRRCLDLLPKNDPDRARIFKRLQRCEQLLAADQKLPAILRGEPEPTDAAECLALALLCQFHKHRNAAAARYYADAFSADPKLAVDLDQQHRYNAACSAVLAAAGQGDDAKDLPDKVQLMLRRQALRWLRADLAVYAQLAGRKEAAVKQAVRQLLAHWQVDPDFASVRDKAGLDKLPVAERAEWQRLWTDVAALRDRASTP